MKKKGFLLLIVLALMALLLAQAALAECDLHWEANNAKHRQYCNGCKDHSTKTYLTGWESHSYQLRGYTWPETVDRVNGRMPSSVVVRWDLNNSGRACSVCEHFDRFVPDSAGDTASLRQSTLETCTTAGSYTYQTAGYTWSNMTLRVQKTYTVPALGHDWSKKDGTCARSGCRAVCAHEEAQKSLTCTEGTTCGVCGKTLSPLGHDWSNKDGVCARTGCGAVCAHEEAQKHLTCTEGTTCGVCKMALEPLGHDWSNKDGVCARTGCDEVCAHEEALKRVTCIDSADCDVCGKTLEALGHDYKAEVTKPTCTTDGYTRYTCINCNDTYTADVVKKLSHWYGEWSPNADGTHSAACKRAKCRYTAERACQPISYTLPVEAPVVFTLCPVCGEADDGTRLALVKAKAKAVTKRLPSGEIVLRMGEAATGDILLSAGFEYAGRLTQPRGQVEITLPAELLNGYTLSLLNADGTEADLPFTVNGETVSFTLNFEVQPETPTMLLRLVPTV